MKLLKRGCDVNEGGVKEKVEKEGKVGGRKEFEVKRVF